MPIWVIIWTALMAVNVLSFSLFGIDKGRARRGEWRISESTLIGTAAFGGIFGAYLGRAWFRHKTRKREFSLGLHLTAITQGALAAYIIWKVLPLADTGAAR